MLVFSELNIWLNLVLKVSILLIFHQEAVVIWLIMIYCLYTDDEECIHLVFKKESDGSSTFLDLFDIGVDYC